MKYIKEKYWSESYPELSLKCFVNNNNNNNNNNDNNKNRNNNNLYLKRAAQSNGMDLL